MNRACLCASVLLFSTIAAAQQLPFGDLPAGTVRSRADCSAAPDEASRTDCALRELRYADGRLNGRYGELRRRLRKDEAAGLTQTQRAWLKDRDASCRLERGPRDRNAWLAYVAQSQARTACVLQATQGRIAELEDMQRRLDTPPLVAQVVPPAADAALSGESAAAGGDGYVIRSKRSHRGGRRYFEVVIDQARADRVEASVIARVNAGGRWVGTSYHIHPRSVEVHPAPGASIVIEGGAGLPKVVMGVAVDLDAGRLYRSRDGVWLGGAVPGSPQGVALRRDVDFVAEVFASVRLDPLVQQGIVKVNYGEQAFERPPPAGYRGFDSPDAIAEAAPPGTLPEIYSADERVAGQGQVQWVRRYWEWVRSFSASESPSADRSGYRCGAGQSGPVWFLTGSTVAEPVRRECDVPEGKILLVPIANTLAQANPGAKVGCDELIVSLRQFGENVAELRMKMNALALDRPQRFLFGSGCFGLRDGSSGQMGLAAGTGYWVFVKPLKKGRHEIQFGGRFRDGFRQDVSYVLHVR